MLREGSGKVEGRFREDSGDVQGRFKELSRIFLNLLNLSTEQLTRTSQCKKLFYRCLSEMKVSPSTKVLSLNLHHNL